MAELLTGAQMRAIDFVTLGTVATMGQGGRP